MSAVKCDNCIIGNVLPINSLDYESDWKCFDCAETLKLESKCILITEQLRAHARYGQVWPYLCHTIKVEALIKVK